LFIILYIIIHETFFLGRNCARQAKSEKIKLFKNALNKLLNINNHFTLYNYIAPSKFSAKLRVCSDIHCKCLKSIAYVRYTIISLKILSTREYRNAVSMSTANGRAEKSNALSRSLFRFLACSLSSDTSLRRLGFDCLS